MKAEIDRSGCISCGLCEDVCPEVFRLAGDGLAEVHGEITPKTEEDAKEAADGCPVEVISIDN